MIEKDKDRIKGGGQEKNTGNRYIRFDWAMKRLLRNKANFGVLEGFLTTLLGEKVVIQKLLESESNQEDEFDKYNRVDLLAEDSRGELILIEVQNNTEYAYFQRMLFGTSKLVTEYINRGHGYEDVRKVYSVNIVYFSLGHGKDTVYHGKTEFRGIHMNDVLELTPFQRQTFQVDAVSQLYPEYYILKVNNFNDVAKSPLEEWIYYLNTGEVPADATAPGLEEVREQLKLDRMTREELNAYYRHLDNLVILRDNIFTGRAEGIAEGMVEGMQKGMQKGMEKGIEKGMRQGIEKGMQQGIEKGMQQGIEKGKTEEKYEVARNLRAKGVALEVIAECTGLSPEEIEKL